MRGDQELLPVFYTQLHTVIYLVSAFEPNPNISNSVGGVANLRILDVYIVYLPWRVI